MKVFFIFTVTFLVIKTCDGQFETNVCTTPNEERASCISLFSCPILLNSMGSSNPSTIDFIKKSLCGDCNDGDIKVCCGTSTSFSNSIKPAVSNSTTKESHRDFVIRKLVPSRRFCGLQHTDDRFYNATETALDEFPWLVHIKWYDIGDEGDFNERCNGVLISNQYVLTDYLCGFHARTVKLGQHATSTNFSCIEDPNFPECTDPVLEIPVEEKFRWGIPTRSGSYNFVLIRLAKKITYTDYIRPICLPIDDSIRSQKRELLTFSGWGAKGPTGISKKRLIYHVTTEDVCYKAQPFLEGNVKSAKVDLICLAAPKENKLLACNGDHGGPLMFSHSHQWFAQGILITVLENMGSDYCSNEHPLNGIAITPKVIEWILSNMHS